jgi:hypothetical protein
LFGLAVNWKRRRPDRLSRLVAAIEAIGDRDRLQADENTRLDLLRSSGAVALYEICREFVDSLNDRLSDPSLILDPQNFGPDKFHDPGQNLFQINLRGRLLMIEFEATGEPWSTDDYRRPYILQGVIRSLNQDLLERNLVSEKTIFYCPSGNTGTWHFMDNRSYRTGRFGPDLLAAELERLI